MTNADRLKLEISKMSIDEMVEFLLKVTEILSIKQYTGIPIDLKSILELWLSREEYHGVES